MTTVTLRNEFHGSEVTLRVNSMPCELSASQVRRARNTLCGISGCTCGGPLGERGPQDVRVDYIDQDTIGLWERD